MCLVRPRHPHSAAGRTNTQGLSLIHPSSRECANAIAPRDKSYPTTEKGAADSRRILGIMEEFPERLSVAAHNSGGALVVAPLEASAALKAYCGICASRAPALDLGSKFTAWWAAHFDLTLLCYSPAEHRASFEQIKAAAKHHPFPDRQDGDLHVLARSAYSEGILAHLNSLGWTDCGKQTPPAAQRGHQWGM